LSNRYKDFTCLQNVLLCYDSTASAATLSTRVIYGRTNLSTTQYFCAVCTDSVQPCRQCRNIRYSAFVVFAKCNTTKTSLRLPCHFISLNFNYRTTWNNTLSSTESSKSNHTLQTSVFWATESHKDPQLLCSVIYANFTKCTKCYVPARDCSRHKHC